MRTAAAIARALAGRRAQRLAGGGYLVPCPLASHGKGRGDRNPSLHIGDGCQRLLVYCFAGCNARDVLYELRRRGLLDDRDVKRRDPPPSKKRPLQIRDDYADRQRRKATWLWSRRRAIGGTLAETYLRQACGITCPLPATLGFLPPFKPEHSPALIAAFGLPDEPEPGVLAPPHNVTAVHLTLLKPDGSGKVDAPKTKLIVGSPGALPLALAPVNDLAITEGIEDALSVYEATGLGAWAACGASRMPALADAIPRYVKAVTVFADDDIAGRRSAHQLAENIVAIGNAKIFIAEGAPDINDLLRSEGPDGVRRRRDNAVPYEWEGAR
jgi:hypothetical protein